MAGVLGGLYILSELCRMKLKQAISLKECAGFLGCSFVGDADARITGINEIHKVEEGDLTFVDFHKYYERALQSRASFILINKETACPPGKGLLFSQDPFGDYVKLVRKFHPFQPSLQPVSDDAVIGDGTLLYPGVYIGKNCRIGKHCILYPNVVLYDNTEIGDRVIIHANTTIGADAFYFKKREGYYDKLESCGCVFIGDDVEIGAGCTIDKGVSGETRIGAGSKLDNHIHIGHGAVIGKRCLFAAQVGIGGKTIIGNDVILWGQVGISKDLHIGDGVMVLAQSGVGKDLEAGKTYFGSPADEARRKWREISISRNIYEIWEKIKNAKDGN